MHLRNRWLLGFLLVGLVLTLGAQVPQNPSTPPSTPPPAPPQNATPDKDNGVFVFRKNVDEVVLHATVVDDHQRLVTSLDRDAFTVFEDGTQQQITSFRHEDIPVDVGVVIDDSGSMRDKRSAVNQAAINLVRASNPQDEVFIVNFSEEYWLDQDFTASIPKLQEALENIDSRGGTALYDAVIASADHLTGGKLDKKVLLVVTDGEDNASRNNLEQTIRRLQEMNSPTVYTIGILGEDHPRRAKRALERLAYETGGVAYFPKNLSQVDAITREIARDIRNQYTIGYKPAKPQGDGSFRSVRVTAKAHGFSKLEVRTRSGYYATPRRSASGGSSSPSQP
jgi:VWFA-related protein